MVNSGVTAPSEMSLTIVFHDTLFFSLQLLFQLHILFKGVKHVLSRAEVTVFITVFTVQEVRLYILVSKASCVALAYLRLVSAH